MCLIHHKQIHREWFVLVGALVYQLKEIREFCSVWTKEEEKTSLKLIGHLQFG